MTNAEMLNILVIAVGLLAQAEPSNVAATSSVISGRVRADDTGEPVPDARVTVLSIPNAPIVRSDRDGRFEVLVPAGALRIAISKSGYVRREVSRAAPDRSIDIRLSRASAVAGRILDLAGDPVIGALVSIESVLEDGRTAPVKSTQSDDNGEYRIGGLSTGTLVVAVRVMNTMTGVRLEGRTRSFSPDVLRLYYPAATRATDAGRIRLGAGTDRSGVDISVPAQYSGGEPFGMVGLVRQAQARPATDSDKRTARIRGRVVTAGGQPIARAQVRLLPSDDFVPMRAAITDDEGRIAFTGIPAGTYRVAAAKGGYAPLHEEDVAVASLPDLGAGPLVTLADGDSRSVEIMLGRLRAISGYVTDEHGDPIDGGRVQLLQVRYAGGRRSLVRADVAARVTDDRGHYRVFGVRPGDYIVSASVGPLGSAELAGYARTYFPGSIEPAQARFVSIGAVQDVSGIDFALERARTAHVSGRILDAAGEPTTGGAVRITPAGRSTVLRNVSTGARISRAGEFDFDNVAPGDYIIRADRGRAGAAVEGEFGVLPVTVTGDDVGGLVLRMSAGSSIVGRFRFEIETDTRIPDRSAIELSPVGVDPDLTPDSVAAADIHDDWTFEIHGLNGKRRLALIHLPPEWALKEITSKGNDVTDRILSFGTKEESLSDVEVVLTDRVGELNGTVADARGRPGVGSHVIVASMDRRHWYPASRFLRHAVVERDGTFRVTGLPAATYYVASSARVPTDGDDAWQDPEFLDSIITRGTTVTLQGGDKRSVHLETRDR